MIGALVAGITGAGGASLSSYESIATATGTGSSGTITFSSIPSTFKHLQLRIMARGTAAATRGDLYLYMNTDTGTNYTYHYLYGSGSTAGAGGAGTQGLTYLGSIPYGSASASIMGTAIVDILDYASTTKYKTQRTFNGEDQNGSGYVYLVSGLWMNTAAITTLEIKVLSGNLSSNTTVALYGIKEA